jgi:hypothetical protein
MKWKEYLKLTTSKSVITIFLIAWVVFAVPFMNMSHTYCEEKGENCSSDVERTSLVVCLAMNFHEEHFYEHRQTSNTYYVRECSKSDLLWLLIIVPLIYLISSFMDTKIADARRHNPKEGRLILILAVLTLVPGFIFGTFAYVFFPFNFIFVTSIGMLAFLALVACFLAKFLEKSEMKHPWLYSAWILYVVSLLLGLIFAFAGMYPY